MRPVRVTYDETMKSDVATVATDILQKQRFLQSVEELEIWLRPVVSAEVPVVEVFSASSGVARGYDYSAQASGKKSLATGLNLTR